APPATTTAATTSHGAFLRPPVWVPATWPVLEPSVVGVVDGGRVPGVVGGATLGGRDHAGGGVAPAWYAGGDEPGEPGAVRYGSTWPIAPASSLMSWKRAAGSFSRQWRTMASTSGGMPGQRLDGAGAGSRRCAARISPMPSASNGGLPTMRWNSTQPSA